MSARLHRSRNYALALGLASSLAPALASAAPPERGEVEPVERPILLLMTEPDELGDAVARAIATELNDVEVRLEALALAPASSLDARLAAAEQLVGERAALGLIWIESRADGLVVHLVVADAGMLRRPIVGFDEREQAVETAAVVVRHFVLELLAGRPIGLTPPSREPEAPVEPADGPAPVDDELELPPPEPDAPPRPSPWLGDRGHLRLQAGYLGQTWIHERAWDSAVEISVGWRAAVGAHVGVAFAVAPAFELELVHPGNRGAAQLRVRRYPLALAAGYQHVWSKPGLAVDAQLRVGVELIERGVFDPNNITPQLDRPLVAVPTLEPRIGLDYRLIPQLAVFAAVGVRTSLVRVDYRVAYTDADGQVIAQERPITPRVVAPVVLVGLDMYF